MGKTKDAVTLQVEMASLPDGTAKKIQVTTTNSNYQKLGGGY